MQNTPPRTSGSKRPPSDARPRSAGKAYARSGQNGARRPAPKPGAEPRRAPQNTAHAHRRPRRPSGAQGMLMWLKGMASTRNGLIALCGGAVGVVLIVVLACLAIGGGAKPDVTKEPVQAASNNVAVEAAEESDALTASEDEPAEAASTQTATSSEFKMTPTGDSWRKGKYAPEPLDMNYNYLPVFKSAAREDKVIAVTVDDCFQTENLKAIVAAADTVGGKLTIFPIGNLLKRTELQEVIKAAHAEGHEIENHTWTHDGLYNLTAEQLAQHIFDQDRAVDLVLGVNYHTHFLRPKGGDDRNDLRTHSYIRQLGYYGIAHWSVSGAMNIDKLKSSLSPGAVYLFHCTDEDLVKLQEFIPYADVQGYKLITFNDMFGYEKNEEELLTDDPYARTIIPLEPYERDYKTIRATTYDYAAYEVQAALIEKGFLTGEPDGVYGTGTAKSAAAWQAIEGYPGDGVLTPEQQKKLLGVE